MLTDIESTRRVLAFDIGIKNLAWCCMEKGGSTYKILGWDNYNLLEEESVGSVTEKCRHVPCKVNAIYTCGVVQDGTPNFRCGRHIPPAFQQFKDENGKPLKKLPAMGVMKKLWKELPVGVGEKRATPSGKDGFIDALSHSYAIPIVVKKVTRNPDANLASLHDSIMRLVEKNRELWGSCNVIALENQPAFKNPTMKSVQILLFASIRGGLESCPPVKLVHAKKKVEGGEKGDKGYKARKDGSENRVLQFMNGSGLTGVEPWMKLWTAAKKKSDLADGLCMCLDQLA